MTRQLGLAWIASLSLVVCQGAAHSASPQAAPDPVELLQQLIRMDSSNPPGDTTAIAAHLKKLFDQHGIDNEIILAPNGKAAHFLARLKGDGSRKPVLIAAHTDVVPVQRERWSVDPFAGIEKNGFIYGRGALDNKGSVAAYATAVIRLKNERVKLKRDVIFLAEADEEQGEFNTNWLAREHWSKLDAEFSLNEGGTTLLADSGAVSLISVGTYDKLTLNLKLIASGRSGHSSRPLPLAETANGQLITALARLASYETNIELSDVTREYLRVLSGLNPGPFADAVAALFKHTDQTALKQDAARMIAAGADDGLGVEGLVRNTLVITMINSGVKPNVIPGTAEAVLNARLLPGHTVDAFIAEISRVIDNPKIRMEMVHRLPQAELVKLYDQFEKIKPSALDTSLFAAIGAAARKTWPTASVAPTLVVGSTDATPWRLRGIPVYGIGLFPVDQAASATIHGDDERVAIKSVREGTDFAYDILRRVTTAP